MYRSARTVLPAESPRDDLVLELVCKIDSVEERHRGRAKGVPLLRAIDLLAYERGTPQPGIHDGMSLDLEPFPKDADLGRSGPSHPHLPER